MPSDTRVMQKVWRGWLGWSQRWFDSTAEHAQGGASPGPASPGDARQRQGKESAAGRHRRSSRRRARRRKPSP
jgi:hypothetical protein